MKKKALIIGGTGTISLSLVKLLAEKPVWEVFLLNRGNRNSSVPAGVHSITADIHSESDVRSKLQSMHFDTVCEFVGFCKEDAERDFRLFSGQTDQYIFTSSASAYHKPSPSYLVSEGTGLSNPYWKYARDKIDCEKYLIQKYREYGFPVTIVRPSHTYDERKIPLGVHGKNGSWQVVRRMLDGKPVIIQGDGTSLWTLTHSIDFAVGYEGLMGNPHAVGEAFQITGSETLTWNQIYQIVAKALGVPLHAYHISSDFLAAAGDPFGYDFTGSLIGDKSVSVVFDNRKLLQVVPAMKTNIRFDQGIRMCLDYIFSHPDECQKEDPEFDAWCDRVIHAVETAKSSLQMS